MEKRYKQTIMKYEPDADVLSWEVSRAPIDYAEEVGNVVVHFSKQGKPVLIEMLEASKLVKKADKLMQKPSHMSFSSNLYLGA